MMPVVLGSSSSSDPYLLRQANSLPYLPKEHRPNTGSTEGHYSSSSKASMLPPPAPESNQQSNRLGPLQVRQVTRDPSRPIFFAFVPARPYETNKGKGKEIGAQGLIKLKAAVRGKIGSLMTDYCIRDAAAFPLLMESQRKRYREAAVEVCKSGEQSNEIPLPAVLAAATLATGIIYDIELRSISKSAWGANLQALTEQFGISTLVTLQVALTDLTGRPSINTSGNFMSFSQTLAISHMLGLHLDPTNWVLPREEKDVRIRIWWAIMIHDKWSSLCWGRPSVIHDQDYSTPLPRRNSLSPCQEHLEDRDLKSYQFKNLWPLQQQQSDQQEDSLIHTPGDTFVGLCRLTLILSDILSEFHSIRSSSNEDPFGVAQKVKNYLVRVEDWKDLLPYTLRTILQRDQHSASKSHGARVPGTRSLQLSYLGVNLLLCRTALDAVTTTKGSGESFNRLVVPAHRTALHSALMVVEFLESLSAEDYNGFFLHYGSHHIASCLSLLARLSLGFYKMGEEDLLATSITKMQRLLIVLSQAHRLYSWDLAELALTRSRAILPTLEARIPNYPLLFPMESEDDETSSPLPESVAFQQEQQNYQADNAPATGTTFGHVVGNISKAAASRKHVSATSSTSATDASASASTLPIHTNTPFSTGPSHHEGEESESRQIAEALFSHDQAGLSNMFSFSSGYNGIATRIPVDATGLPYPLGMLGNNVLPTNQVSGHILSGIEADWLGMGL
jgi:hypothetical protein